MVRKKDIKQINDKIDAISGTIMRKATAYDRDHDFLKEITVNVEKCNIFFDEISLRYAIKIEYGISPTVIYVDDNGETSFNPKLKALNELKLIPIEQLDNIIHAIERVKKMNQEG